MLQWLPSVWGIGLTAIACGSVDVFSADPWAAVVLATEVAFVAWQRHRGGRNLILADSLYWLILGVPASGLFYGYISEISGAVGILPIVLARACNGIFNATIASLLAWGLPLKPEAISEVAVSPEPVGGTVASPQQRTFDILFACVCFPLLAIAAFNSYQSAWMLEARAQGQLTADVAVERDARTGVALQHRGATGEAPARSTARAPETPDREGFSWRLPRQQPGIGEPSATRTLAVAQTQQLALVLAVWGVALLAADRISRTLRSIPLQQLLQRAELQSPSSQDSSSMTADLRFAEHRLEARRTAAEATPLDKNNDWQAIAALDPSEGKGATAEVRDARNFLQAAVDALPIAISIKTVRPDGGGKYLLWNKASEALFDIPASRAVGRTDGHLFPAARVEAQAASENEALISQQPTEIQYEEVDRATSERRSLRIANIPLFDAAGRLQYLLGYTEDITPRLQAERKQRERERRWENLIGATTDALLVVNEDGQICFHNPAAERLFGRSTAELTDYEFGRVLPATKKEFTEIEILQPNGRFVFAQMRVVDIDWEGEPALLASLTDVTERHAAEIALRRREANYRGLVDNLDAGVAVFAPDTSIMLCNAKTCELFGLAAAELLGKRIEDLSLHWCREDGTPLLPEDYPVNQVLQQRVPLRQFVFGIAHERDEPTWVLANAFPEFDQEQQLQQVVVTFTDISSLKQAETRLRHAALHDSLTGLPNRTLLVERLDRALKHAHRHPEYWFAVLFIDLDRFKTINDSLGHQVGDLLLLEVARCLQGIVRANDTVCRLGGDEFVILLDGVCDAREVSYVAERIQESLQSLQQIDGCEIATSASIGIALSQETYAHADEMLRDADTAMYRAKASGRACSEIFDRAMHEQVLERFQLETSLRRAIERNEFLLNYQPIVSHQDRQILGFEALVRWQHPELGYLSPNKFIPIAEETGLIVPLGAWVLEAACHCMRSWQDRLPEEVMQNLKMGVNVSARQFQEGDFLATIDRALLDAGLPPQCLNIEVTEGSLLSDVERTIDTLRGLRQRRVNVSIDDFGTGYSSLSYLKRFPIDTLKIDRSFVVGLGSLAEDERIVEAIVTLARTFGLGVVAEGVETELQLARIEAMGCRAVQGNWFSPPLDALAAAELLLTCNQPVRKSG